MMMDSEEGLVDRVHPSEFVPNFKTLDPIQMALAVKEQLTSLSASSSSSSSSGSSSWSTGPAEESQEKARYVKHVVEVVCSWIGENPKKNSELAARVRCVIQAHYGDFVTARKFEKEGVPRLFGKDISRNPVTTKASEVDLSLVNQWRMALIGTLCSYGELCVR